MHRSSLSLLLLVALTFSSALTLLVGDARAGACTQTKCTCNSQCSGTLVCSAEGLCCGIQGPGRPCPADAGGDGGNQGSDDDGCSYGGRPHTPGALSTAAGASTGLALLALLRRRRRRL
jgi:hypothetical protein